MTKHPIRISPFARDLIEDLCNAYAHLILQEKDSPEALEAYAALTQRKKEMFEYIGSAERSLRIPQEAFNIHVFEERHPSGRQTTVRLVSTEESPYRKG